MKVQKTLAKCIEYLELFQSHNFEIAAQYNNRKDWWEVKMQIREKSRKSSYLDVPFIEMYDSLDKAKLWVEKYLSNNFNLECYEE